MSDIEKVCKFLEESGTYYLATVEGDQPRVRPFGTVDVFEGKLYIQTGKVKAVSKQLQANPKAEICAFADGTWVRVAGELVRDDRLEALPSAARPGPSPSEAGTFRRFFRPAGMFRFPAPLLLTDRPES